MTRPKPQPEPILAGGIVTVEPPPPPTAEQRIAAVMQRARRHVARTCYRGERIVVSPAVVEGARQDRRAGGWHRVGRLTDLQWRATLARLVAADHRAGPDRAPARYPVRVSPPGACRRQQSGSLTGGTPGPTAAALALAAAPAGGTRHAACAPAPWAAGESVHPVGQSARIAAYGRQPDQWMGGEADPVPCLPSKRGRPPHP